MDYFHQAAMYQEGYAVASGRGEMLPFGIVAVERKPPHACRLFWLDEESIERAWADHVRSFRGNRGLHTGGHGGSQLETSTDQAKGSRFGNGSPLHAG